MENDQKIDEHVRFASIDWTSVSTKELNELFVLQRNADDSLLGEIQLMAASAARLTSLVITCVVVIVAFLFHATPRTVFALAFFTQLLLYVIDVVGTYGMRLLKTQATSKLNDEMTRLVKKHPR